MTLEALNQALRSARGMALKRDIARAAGSLPHAARAAWLAADAEPVRNGDDAAAIPDGDGYLLLAAEGMLPSFVASDPWFAGFCAVMVNVSDILAMGGRPYAVVDVLFGDAPGVSSLFAGMRAAAELFGVPVVGGHTSRGASQLMLAAAIVGRARRLITSFDARPGDELLVAVDLRGAYRGDTNYFDAATSAEPRALRAALAILPELAESGLVAAGKDVSMASFAGTLCMLCESSGVGATLDLDRLPRPQDVPLARWLTSFPSFGFLLAVDPAHSGDVSQRFAAAGVACARAGRFEASSHVLLRQAGEQVSFWDLAREPLTGFGPQRSG
jgi:AIR synthase-related protein